MTTRVYIGRLSREAHQRDIEKLFKGYGDIREVNLKNGFGFVEFRDHKDAEDVVYDFHGKEFFGERLIVELARGDRARRDRPDRYERRRDDRYGPTSRTQYRLVVEGIAPGTSWQDLKDFMRKAGEVTFADILKDRDGEGVVEFSSFEDMRKAIKKLDGEELKGSKVTLREQKRDRRSTSRSRSRSPPRRRSRSSSLSNSRSQSRSPPRRNVRRSSRSRSPRDRHARRKRDRRERERSRSRSRSHTHSEGEEDDKRKRSRRSGSEEAPARERSRSKSPVRSSEKRERKEHSPGRRSGRGSRRNLSPSPEGSGSRSGTPKSDQDDFKSNVNKDEEDMEE